MSSQGSVTYWLGRLQAGDPAAAQRLWESYFARLVGLARQKLRGAARRTADEEDVALSAFDSFCRGVTAGRFPQLEDRDNLWHLLVTLTVRKAVALRRYEARQKRGGAPLGEATAAGSLSREAEDADVEQILGREPTPEFAAQVAEECQRLLGLLQDAGLRDLALRKMEGYTNDELAVQRGCVPRTIERKLRVIRKLWSQEKPS
jgi:DNA-directed RNA polymerase specialized sigma24 family protein